MVKNQGWCHHSSATQTWAHMERMLLGGKIIQVISEWAIDVISIIDNEKSQSLRDKWVSGEFAVETACSLLLLKHLLKKEISWSTHTKFGTENHVKCRRKATYILYFQCTHVQASTHTHTHTQTLWFVRIIPGLPFPFKRFFFFPSVSIRPFITQSLFPSL